MKKSYITLIAVILGSMLWVVGTSFAGYGYGYGYGYSGIRVTIKNLTKGQIFSPPVVIVHNSRFSLFETGEAASLELALLAEDGDNGDLMGTASEYDSVLDVTASDTAVLPGTSVTLEVPATYRFNHISLAGMLVTTNDAFVAVRGEKIPFGSKKTTLYALAYDAGSEVNSESCAYVPGPPCGNGGMHDPAEAEGFIYIHGGIHGIGELETHMYDWKNPVAEITLEYIY